MSAGGFKWTVVAGLLFAAVVALFLIGIRDAFSPPPVEVKVADTPAKDGVVKVYITGAVARPGVYEARQGDRFADALALAGGVAEDADPLAVNMARRVRDEEHIHVPRRGEPGLLTPAGDPVLDLNTASAQQLESLPGIGPTRAQRIVESRAKEGAFVRPDDLVQRKIIPQSMLELLRERIQVRP